MSHYVDNIVVPVPKAKLDAYRALAERAAQVWKDHGALQYWECLGDDVPPGTATSFPQSLQLQDDEVVAVAWIVYASREDRDAIMAKVMADPRMADMTDPANHPFDGKRMFWGGFKSIVEA